MDLSNLKPAKGAKQNKKRVGRGPGSGNGKTAGRGHKGAQSRSGYSYKRGFEGGQMPLHRRLPKRGFNNLFRTEYAVVNLDQLEASFDQGATITPDALRERRPGPRQAPADQGARPRRSDQGADGAGAQVQRQGGGKAGCRGRQGRGNRLDARHSRGRAEKPVRCPGPAQPSVVHARHARGLSRRQLHPDAGGEPRRRWPNWRGRCRTRCSVCTTCSPAGRCRRSRSSRSASCRTSARRSSCSC